MQILSFFKKNLFSITFLLLLTILCLSFPNSKVFGQSNQQTVLKVNKPQSTEVNNSEMSDFNSNLKLGKAFFLTLDISKFGNMEDVGIAVSVNYEQDIDLLFKGEIERLSKNDTITLPIYLNLDLPQGHSSISVDMTFKDMKGRSFKVNDRVYANLQ